MRHPLSSHGRRPAETTEFRSRTRRAEGPVRTSAGVLVADRAFSPRIPLVIGFVSAKLVTRSPSRALMTRPLGGSDLGQGVGGSDTVTRLSITGGRHPCGLQAI